ncbi:MAG: c-type cytochrome [Chloroflexi bacterium]|nr:c-type cytochrome [Chloroflexota bacterium]
MLALLVFAPLALLNWTGGALPDWYAGTVVNLAASRAAPARVPATRRQGQDARPNAPQLEADAGRNAYTGSCALCHGDKGDGHGTLGRSMAPIATDLTSASTEDKSDAELFWIVKDGLSFSAMPGFDGQYQDADIAALVAYIRLLERGQPEPVAIPTPSAGQLSQAADGSPAGRGAALFYARGCAACHGPFGDAPDELALQDVSDVARVVRQGRPGMPAYSVARLTDGELDDIVTYLTTPQDDAQ